MIHSKGPYLPYENNARLFKRPEEADIYNMVWHIISADDYIATSLWIIESPTETVPLLLNMVDFVNGTPTYRDRQGAQFDLPWRKSTGILLTAGTAGVDYTLTNEIVTNAGRLLRRTADLSCVDIYPDQDRFADTTRFQS